jgi:hypothetical protein
MVTLASLWLPILVAAVLVFVASSVLHMVLPFHRSDYRPVPSEDGVMDALRLFRIAPGDYLLPCPRGPQAHRSPEFIAKMKKGPVVMMTVMPPGEIRLGGRLAKWFLFCIVVGILSAYVTSRTLPQGTPYLQVFRISGTVAFIGYCVAQWENTIWFSRDWIRTLKDTIDGLIYGLLTGGAFGWLWP